uniref:Cytochrome P450 monooxygenase n=1 Tax=Cordyceps militaris TaxID=73501 RepID=J3S895_CORMI|nr:cytochrome P450 monooxygenase [Cordyceps militaris]
MADMKVTNTMKYSVITTAEDVREFYTDSHVHTKAPSSNAGWLFSLLLGDCLGLISGQKWSELRHLMDPFFSHKVSATRTSSVIAAAAQHLQIELPRLAPQQETNGDCVTVNAVEGFSSFPFFFVAEVIYGKLEQNLKDEMWGLAEEHTQLFRYIVQGGIHRYRISGVIGTEASKKTFDFIRKWESFNNRLYQSQRSQNLQTPLVQMLQASEDKKVTFSEVRGATRGVIRCQCHQANVEIGHPNN